MNPDAPVTKHRMAGLLNVPTANSIQFPPSRGARALICGKACKELIIPPAARSLASLAGRGCGRAVSQGPGPGSSNAEGGCSAHKKAKDSVTAASLDLRR